jgi:hypothetical protein
MKKLGLNLMVQPKAFPNAIWLLYHKRGRWPFDLDFKIQL